MRTWKAVLAASALAASGSASLGSGGELVRTPVNEMWWAFDARGVPYDPTSVLVKFRADTPEQMKQTLLVAIGAQNVEAYTLVPGLVRATVAVGADRAVSTMAGFPRFVEYVEPDYIVHANVTPNDPFYNRLWGLHNTGQTVNGDPGINDADIDAPEAWDAYTGDPNFVVAVIDTGVNYNHPDLAANRWTNPGEIPGNGIDDEGNGRIDDVYGWDFANNDNNPIDDNGHGTHCAGTVGAVGNNGVGVVGVNWRCKIMAMKFLNSAGSGSTSAAISCLQYAVSKGAKVSNNSWSGGGYSSSLFNAINNAQAGGHIFVAAAGNGGPDQIGDNNDAVPVYPASYTSANIVAVGATTNDDARAGFSNYGQNSVDIFAPGVNVYSTYGSGYAYLSGTSMACPHTAGLVSLVYARNPSWTWSQVRSQVLNTRRAVASLATRCVTGGIINAQAAIGPGGNTAPTVTITAPADGSSFSSGSSIIFSGTATDVQDGTISNALIWTSNVQGQIGTGASFATSALTAGPHTITARATDSGGLQGSAAITVTITAAAGPAAPSNPSALRYGRQIWFSWTDNSGNETGFTVQREKSVGGTWTSTTTFTAEVDQTTFINSPGSGLWRYRVQSFNGSGASAWTAWVTATVP